MPIGVMVILVLHPAGRIVRDLAGWAPAFAGIVVTFLVHLKWKNAMPSIVSGSQPPSCCVLA